jgi:uncharacterized protein YaiI (UPF0178 family)
MSKEKKLNKKCTMYIDGDAFVNLLKPIVLRQVEKLKIPTFVVANKKINIGKSDYITYIVVDFGADEADHKIVEMVQEGDLVITADIPLADRIIGKNAHAIDHRGTFYTRENIKQHLAMRNLMESIREMGEITKGPKPFSKKDVEMFANSLNMFLQKQGKSIK